MRSSKSDPLLLTKNAQDSLDAILRRPKRDTSTASSSEEDVQTAREQPLLSPPAGRRTVRVLFITTDTRILTDATRSLDGFSDIADAFDEVHIMVLQTGLPARHPVLRIAKRTWLYTVTAKERWRLPLAAWRCIAKELIFADGCRFDVVIARDQYESAVAAYGAARYYGRASQLHLPLQDTVAPTRLRRLLARYMISRFASVRVETTEALTTLRAYHTTCTDCAVLPRYRNYARDFSGTKTSFLQEQYKKFDFFIIYAGSLLQTKDPFMAIDVVAPLLRNPRIAFIMIGGGSSVMECERRVALLGVERQVIIERSVEDVRPYFAGADVLLVTTTGHQGDEVAFYGAAAGLPLVLVETPARRDLFAATEAALLVAPSFPQRLTEALGRLLNDSRLRFLLRERVRTVAIKTLQSDPAEFRAAFKASVEAALRN